MSKIAAIALGGALGALSRYWLVGVITSLLGRGFPFGTLAVNVAGSFLIGVMYVLIVDRLHLAPEWQAVAMVGFLGAFTTFSTFSLETVNLLQTGRLLAAGTYITLSVLICVLATALAIWLTHAILNR